MPGIVRDITAGKNAEDRLRQAYRQRDEFFANVNHAIRSPMAALMGYADLLTARLKDPTDREHVKMIKDSGDYLLALINDQLELAKLEAGKLAIRREPVPLARLLNEVHAFMDSRAQEKGLRFSLRFDGSVPKAIVTDAARLRQALINLLANAIKFTESGQIELTTRFDGARSQREFEVVATRIGIAPESYDAQDDRRDSSVGGRTRRRFGDTAGTV